ncbi:MAG: hypothetical protein KGZ69_07875, partial [Methylomonas sp.]|nr:hypothetical protein [Methylomonas sp.]
MSLPALPDDLRAFSNIQPATMSGPLVPAEVCKRLITEAERWVPCGPGKAAGLARILVGSYPARDLSDPEIYTRAIVSVFAEAPEWAGSAAVD